MQTAGTERHDDRRSFPFVVVVHGVGNPKPGASLGPLCAGIGDTPPIVRRSGLQHGDARFALLEPSGSSPGTTLAEMNWADVLRPDQNWFGVASHLIRLAFCMLYLTEHWPRRSPSRLLRGY